MKTKDLVLMPGKIKKSIRNLKKELKSKGLAGSIAPESTLDLATYQFKKRFYEKQLIEPIDKLIYKRQLGLWDSRKLRGFHLKMLEAKKEKEFWVDKKLFGELLNYLPDLFRRAGKKINDADVLFLEEKFKPFLKACMLEESMRGYRETRELTQKQKESARNANS